MRFIAGIALSIFPQVVVAQEDIAIWDDAGSYRVIGILSSSSLFIIQEGVYFVCDLESESNSYAIRNCFAAISDSQAVAMQGVARRARQNLVDQRAAREAELKMMEADDVRRKAAIASANAAYEAANTAKLEADTVMKQALDALKGVSDDQFAEALKAVLKSNGCVLELEFNSLRNPADFQSILNSLGIGGPISAAAETELKTRSLSTISNLLRNSQVEIGEFSKTIRLKDCN